MAEHDGFSNMLEESLQEKGLVKKGLSDSGSVFYAENLEAISNLFDEKIRSVSEAKASIKNLEKIINN